MAVQMIVEALADVSLVQCRNDGSGWYLKQANDFVSELNDKQYGLVTCDSNIHVYPFSHTLLLAWMLAVLCRNPS